MNEERSLMFTNAAFAFRTLDFVGTNAHYPVLLCPDCCLLLIHTQSHTFRASSVHTRPSI